jgi:hypothetical protein
VSRRITAFHEGRRRHTEGTKIRDFVISRRLGSQWRACSHCEIHLTDRIDGEDAQAAARKWHGEQIIGPGKYRVA